MLMYNLICEDEDTDFSSFMIIGFLCGFLIGTEYFSLIGAYFLSIIIGSIAGFIEAYLGAKSSESFKDEWQINKRKTLNNIIGFCFAFAVFVFALWCFDNKVVIVSLFTGSYILFSKWKRILKRNISLRKILIISLGFLIGLLIPYSLDITNLFGFCFPILGVLIARKVYSKFLFDQNTLTLELFFTNIKVFGKISALEGAYTNEEFEFFESRFLYYGDDSKEIRNRNQTSIQAFEEANKNADELEKEIKKLVKYVFVSEKEEYIFEIFSDICIFAMIRNKGNLSEQKYKILLWLGNEFDIHQILVERIINQLKGMFNHHWESNIPRSRINIEDYFEILGCDVNDDFESVKKAYYIMCKINHPDRIQSLNLGEKAVTEATQKMQIINEAYQKIKEYKNWK